jgi:hypothetical protein
MLMSDLPLLQVCLSAMPRQTQAQQGARFAGVRANLEFATWVPLDDAEQIAYAAMQKGYVVWGNSDATSAHLYGAGIVKGEDGVVDAIMWLRSITKRGENGQALVHNTRPPHRLIKFDSTR